MKQVKFQLKNKLQVILIPSHKSPVVSVQMWVKTGSADEKKGEEGISHFIEHLVFKGTEKYKVGEIASLVEASGGELNAYTSFDQTVFYVTISKSFEDVALDVVSQMMGHPTFDPDEVHSEREVVCEEIKMGLDSPGRQASQLLFSSVFKKHGYGTPVIGYEKNVRGWSVKKIKAYFESRYVPSNMCLIVSGDFEDKSMKDKVTKYFSSFKPNKLKKIKRTPEPTIKSPRFLAQTKDLKDTTFYLAFPAPSIKHKDVPAIDVLTMILGQGETSRLFSKLRLESNLVSTISCSSYNPQDAGLLAVNFKVSDQDPIKAFEGIYEEIIKVQNQLISWDEIKKAIINISSEQFYSIETVDGIANKIGSSQFYLNDSTAHEKYLKDILKITPEILLKTAKKYFDIDKACYSALGPKATEANIKIMKSSFESWKKQNKLQKVSQLKTRKENKLKDKKGVLPKVVFKAIKKATHQDFEIYNTDKGSKIIFKLNQEIPTVSAKILFGGGSRLESLEKAGTTEMLARTWMGATQTKTEAEILKIIEDSASGLTPFGGKNTVGLSFDYMSAFENQILDLGQEVLTQAVFKDDVLDREKLAVLRQLKSRQDQPSFLCGQQFVQNMFPDHPVSIDQMGNEKSISEILIGDLEKYYQQFFSPANMLSVVVGDFNKKTWIELIEEIEKKMGSGKKQLQSYPVKALQKSELFFLEKDKEQSHVIVGWQGLSITDPDRYVLQIIQAIMAGQGGRLFIELRDKNSLAYSVSPIRMESLECGYFGGYIACSPDKVKKAIEMFHQEFEKIKSEPVSKDELLRAQRYLIGQNDIGLQRKSALCNIIAFDDFYGNDFNESLACEKKFMAVTEKDILRVAQKILNKPYITSIVGRAT